MKNICFHSDNTHCIEITQTYNYHQLISENYDDTRNSTTYSIQDWGRRQKIFLDKKLLKRRIGVVKGLRKMGSKVFNASFFQKNNFTIDELAYSLLWWWPVIHRVGVPSFNHFTLRFLLTVWQNMKPAVRCPKQAAAARVRRQRAMDKEFKAKGSMVLVRNLE